MVGGWRLAAAGHQGLSLRAVLNTHKQRGQPWFEHGRSDAGALSGLAIDRRWRGVGWGWGLGATAERGWRDLVRGLKPRHVAPQGLGVAGDVQDVRMALHEGQRLRVQSRARGVHKHRVVYRRVRGAPAQEPPAELGAGDLRTAAGDPREVWGVAVGTRFCAPQRPRCPFGLGPPTAERHRRAREVLIHGGWGRGGGGADLADPPPQAKSSLHPKPKTFSSWET